MGTIEKLYHRSYELPKRSNAKALSVDAAENIHLHYRDLRIEFSLDEFNEFMEHMNMMYLELQEWQKVNTDWTESDPDTFDDSSGCEFGGPKNKIKENSDYWDDRISLEKKIGGVYHIKWRNYRFEMREEAFKRWLRAFSETIPEFKKDRLPQRKFLNILKRIWNFIKRQINKITW